MHELIESRARWHYTRASWLPGRLSYRNAASENLMKKFRSEICFARARENGISVCKASRYAARGGWYAVYAICIRATVCIHSRGKQTRNYLKRARPGIRIYSFARIIPDEALRANNSMNWRTLVVLLESLFNPRCLLQGTRYRACARQGSPKIQIRLNRSRDETLVLQWMVRISKYGDRVRHTWISVLRDTRDRSDMVWSNHSRPGMLKQSRYSISQ